MRENSSTTLQQEKNKEGHIKRTSILLLALSIINSLIGYLREIVVAASFGAGPTTDSFFSGYAFIITFNDLLISAALTAAVIPVLGRYRNRPGERPRFVTTLSVMILGCTVAASLLLSIFFPWIIDRLVPGLGAGEKTVAVSQGRWLVWLLPAYGLYFLYTMTLNAFHHFIQPALAWLSINLIFTLVVLLTSGFLGPGALLLGAMAGPVLAVGGLFAIVYRQGLIRPREFNIRTPSVIRAWRLSKPMLVTLGIGSSLGLLMVSHLLVRAFGSYTGSGSVSALTYAFRIYEVPLTLAANVAATLVLPVMVTLKAERNWSRIAELSQQIIFWGAILLIPASFALYFESDTIVRILLERRNFTAEDTRLTSSALKGFAPAILFEAVFVVYFRIFYALNQPLIPIYASLLSLFTLFCILLWQEQYGELQQIAASISFSFLAASLAIFYFVRNRLHGQPLPSLRTGALLVGCSLLLGLLWQYALSLGSGMAVMAIRAILLSAGYWCLLLWLFPVHRHQLFHFITSRKSAAP